MSEKSFGVRGHLPIILFGCLTYHIELDLGCDMTPILGDIDIQAQWAQQVHHTLRSNSPLLVLVVVAHDGALVVFGVAAAVVAAVVSGVVGVLSRWWADFCPLCTPSKH